MRNLIEIIRALIIIKIVYMHNLTSNMIKTKIITILVICLGFFPNACFSAPAYGTRMPQKRQFFSGLQTHAVFERELEDPFGEISSVQHFLLISYGISDWLSLDLKGGLGNIRQNPNSGGEISYPTYLGGGYGFRLKIYDENKIKSVFGFQHISVHPYSIDINGVKNKAVLDDWQWSLLVSHDYQYGIPYIGAQWSRMDYIHWVGPDRKRKQSDTDQSVGLIAGVDIPMGDKFWINLEGQFLDVTAVSGSINLQF